MKLRLLVVLFSMLLMILPAQAQDVEVDEIIFARDATYGGVLPIQADDVFPTTITSVYAIIVGEGLETGEEIEIVWLYEGDEQDSIDYENDLDDDEFRVWTNWENEDGMTEGEWSVQVYYDGDLIGEEEFEITDDEYIYPIRFAEDCGQETGILVNENTEFEDIEYIYAQIEWANFDDEPVEVLWEIDGEVYDFDIEFEIDGEGFDCTFLTNGGDPMPTGEYRLYVVDEDGDEFRASDEIDIED